MSREGGRDTQAAGPTSTLPVIDGPLSGEATAVRSFADRANLGVGTIIDGKYEIESVLGEGGMGLVLCARHTELRERVALKFLVSDQEGFDFRARFRREAQICAKIRNEHITRVIDVGTWQGEAYMVMEYLAGNDLAKVLEKSGPLCVADIVEYATQICTGLSEVHAQGIVHRDLKPTNVFVTQRADGSPLVKILDFGISKWNNEPDQKPQGLTKFGTVLGTPEYMAPEQLFGANAVDMRADIWAIGAILYELLAGLTPYPDASFATLCTEFGKGEPPPALRNHRPDVPVEVEAAIMLCLQPNLEKRIPNVAVLAGELLAAVGDAGADTLRLRLDAALQGGPSSAPGSRPPSSSSMKSGDYVAQSLRESGVSSLRPVVDRMKASSGGTVISTQERAPGPSASRLSRVGIAVAAGVLVGGAFMVLSRPSSRRDSGAADTIAMPTVAAPSTPPVIAPSTSATMQAASGAHESAVASELPKPPGVTSASSSPAMNAPPKRHSRPAPAVAMSTSATAAAAAPTASPAVTASASPKKAPNPLEDRQ